MDLDVRHETTDADIGAEIDHNRLCTMDYVVSRHAKGNATISNLEELMQTTWDIITKYKSLIV